MSSTETTPAPPAPRRVPRHVFKRDGWQNTVEWLIGVVNVVAFFAGVSICIGLVDGDTRIACALILVLFGPGSGLVQLVGSFDTTVRVVLLIGVSVAFSTLIAQLLLSLHAISVLNAAIPLTAVTAIGLVVLVVRFVGAGIPAPDEEDE